MMMMMMKNSSSEVSCHIMYVVMTVAPADIDAPAILDLMSDGSVQLRLFTALDSSVDEYMIVVVPEELTKNKRPQDFSLDEVTLTALYRPVCSRSSKTKAKARDSYIARLTGTKPDQPRFTIIGSGS